MRPLQVRLYNASLHPNQFAGRTLCLVFSPVGCPGRVILDLSSFQTGSESPGDVRQRRGEVMWLPGCLASISRRRKGD